MTRLARPALAALFLAALAAGCSGGAGDTGGGGAGTCQGGSFVGGDPAADGDGDGLTNAAECAIGTSPSAADGDGDGLSDGDEVAAGTSPLLADTDGDGLADGEELAAGTDPAAADSDGDGLADGEEGTAGTSPVVADSDGDGLLDGDEVALGLDPTDDTDPALDPTDPAVPSVCDVLQACARDALVPVQWLDRFRGDYRLALPADAVVGDLRFVDGAAPPSRFAATGFDVAAPMVAGFVLSMDEPVADGDPAAQLNALAGRLSAAAGRPGVPWTATELVAGRTVPSWDGFPSVVAARVNLTGATGDAGATRQAALAAMGGLLDGTFAGLPAGAFGAGPFVLSLEVLSRRTAALDAHRVVVVAALAPKGWFDDKTQPTRIVAADLTGGTALGQSGDGEATRCDAMPVEGDPRADFVWMSDVSGSTSDERTPIQQNAAAVFDRLATLGIDFRMGVVRHTANSITDEEPAGRLVSPGFTSDQATFTSYWGDPGADLGREYGLTAIEDVVNPTTGTAMPRTLDGTDGAGNATRVREGVKLVVIYVSDEHAEEVEVACPEIADRTKALASGTEASRAQCIATTVQPFIDTLASQQAIAFGVIADLPGGCSTSYEVGWGYAEPIAALGGSYGSVCASDPGQTLDDIVSAVAGAASSFQLSGDPIAMTLKVVVTDASAPVCDPANPAPGRREVARSQVDGFDYDPVNGTIFFVGPSRPAAGDTVTVSYREWRDETSDPNPDPPACTDCGGCAEGYVCVLSLCQCMPRPG